MKSWLPQSMSGLVALGYIVAATPLAIAIVLAEVSLTRVTSHGETLVRDGVILTRLSGKVRDGLIELERSTRQYAALGNAGLLPVIRERLGRVQDSILEIEQHGRTESIRRTLDQIRDGVAATADNWEASLRDEDKLNRAVARIHDMTQQAQLMIIASNLAIDKEAIRLNQAAEQARRVVTVSVMALIPLTMLLASAFTVLISRPLRRASAGIAALGHGRYDRPITIAYPREMMRLGERLDWLRRRLAELEEDQDRFLRNVSHELKTPLASLKEGIDLLSEGKMGGLSASQQEIADILGESSTELEQLIGNLLTYARWQSEQGPPQMAWFDPYPLVDSVLRVRRLQLVNRDIEVKIDIRLDTLYGDEVRLREALDNLIGNAIKHTRTGTPIEIHIDSRGTQFELSVRDHGSGVPEAEQLHIFDAFVRGSESEETSSRGTGIGLTIVRETANAHGGTVEVTNATPGARFTLQWPHPEGPG